MRWVVMVVVDIIQQAFAATKRRMSATLVHIPNDRIRDCSPYFREVRIRRRRNRASLLGHFSVSRTYLPGVSI